MAERQTDRLKQTLLDNIIDALRKQKKPKETKEREIERQKRNKGKEKALVMLVALI